MWEDFVGDVRIYDVIAFISKYLYFKKVWGSHFCWTHQNFNDVIIKIYEDSIKVKMNRNYVSKCNLYLYFLVSQNLLISGEKMLMSAEVKRYVTWFTYFLDLLWAIRYKCAKFHHCRIYLTDFRGGRGGFLPPSHLWAAPKKPILNRVKVWLGLWRIL